MKQKSHESGQAFINEMSNGAGPMTDKSAKAYYREFVKVIEAADVVLRVCDARDPMGTRCKQVEEAVLNHASTGDLLPIRSQLRAKLGSHTTVEQMPLQIVH